MNQQQRKYARERVDNILQRKIENIRLTHTTPAIQLTSIQRFLAFKNGEYKIKKNIEKSICSYTDIINIVSFNAEKSEKLDRVSMSKARNKVIKQADKVCDEIMLGDTDKAIKLLEQFGNFGVLVET